MAKPSWAHCTPSSAIYELGYVMKLVKTLQPGLLCFSSNVDEVLIEKKMVEKNPVNGRNKKRSSISSSGIYTKINEQTNA